MIRKLVTAAVIAGIATFGAVAPVEAQRLPSARQAVAETNLTAYPIRATPQRFGDWPVCVTTQYRARLWHKPLTRRGAECAITRGMWVPKSWRLVGFYTADLDRAAYDQWDAVIVLAR